MNKSFLLLLLLLLLALDDQNRKVREKKRDLSISSPPSMCTEVLSNCVLRTKVSDSDSAAVELFWVRQTRKQDRRLSSGGK